MPRVALAQLAASPDRDANLVAAIDAIHQAASSGADLICFPETGFSPFFPQVRADPSFFEWAETIPGPTARQSGIVIVVVNRAGQEGDMAFIGRGFVTDPYGNVVARAAVGSPDLLLVDLDPDEIGRARWVIPHFRDRRAELYGPVAEIQGPYQG